MKLHIFERIVLCLIAIGVWIIVGLYIYDFMNGKEVNASVYDPVEVKVVNEIGAYIIN